MTRPLLQGLLLGALLAFVVLGVRHFWRLVMH